MTPQALRAVANALWPYLRENAWREHRVLRDFGSNGANSPFRSIGTASIPNAPRTHDLDVITDEPYIRAAVWADEWPGALNLVTELDRGTYDATLMAIHWDARTALLRAYQLAKCRAPFERTTNRHGTPTLRRNSHDPTITPHVAFALELIAANADTRQVDQHTVDDALLSDDDISLEAVERSLGVRRTGCATL